MPRAVGANAVLRLGRIDEDQVTGFWRHARSVQRVAGRVLHLDGGWRVDGWIRLVVEAAGELDGCLYSVQVLVGEGEIGGPIDV